MGRCSPHLPKPDGLVWALVGEPVSNRAVLVSQGKLGPKGSDRGQEEEGAYLVFSLEMRGSPVMSLRSQERSSKILSRQNFLSPSQIETKPGKPVKPTTRIPSFNTLPHRGFISPLSLLSFSLCQCLCLYCMNMWFRSQCARVNSGRMAPVQPQRQLLLVSFFLFLRELTRACVYGYTHITH